MRILYDSKKPFFKTPFGCLQQEELCTIQVQIPTACKTDSVLLILENENGTLFKSFPLFLKETAAEYECWKLDFSLEDCGLYFYYFKIKTVSGEFSLLKEGSHHTNINYGGKWQLTCYPKGYTTPEDFQGKVMYQIFPDRFCQIGSCDLNGKIEPYFVHQDHSDIPVYYPDENGIIQNNDFFGGNLKGIQSKIPYLKELGVSILYLNPIFKSYSSHRYDTGDYRTIDPMLGNEQDFRNLCAAAHEAGMKVILDGVFSHTGCNSIYFDKYERFHSNGAFNHLDSPYRKWYQFKENSNEYTCWWGINTLPCTEELCPEYMDFIIRDEDSVIAHWLRAGADGFRLDVVDEIPDEFVQLLHKRVKQIKPDALVIGEVWEDASNKIAYTTRRTYFTKSELDSVMNYPFKEAIIGFLKEQLSAESLANAVMSIAENYPAPVLHCLMNLLGTHDTPRILTVFGCENNTLTRDEKAYYKLTPYQKELAFFRLRAAAFLEFTLPGMACIYYGDEAGMEGFEDPFNRRFFPWEHIDENIRSFYLKLTRLKNSEPALQKGTIRVISESGGVFAFARELDGEKIISIVSMQDSYSCFTSYKPLLAFNTEINDEQIILHKYGCLLLKEK